MQIKAGTIPSVLIRVPNFVRFAIVRHSGLPDRAHTKALSKRRYRLHLVWPITRFLLAYSSRPFQGCTLNCFFVMV